MPTPDIPTLLTHLASPHTPTAIRAARDLRWLSESDPAALTPHRNPLIRHTLHTPDVRTRWNLTTVLGHLPFERPASNPDRAAVTDWLFESLSHSSGLVRTKSLQALFDLRRRHPDRPVPPRPHPPLCPPLPQHRHPRHAHPRPPPPQARKAVILSGA